VEKFNKTTEILVGWSYQTRKFWRRRNKW